MMGFFSTKKKLNLNLSLSLCAKLGDKDLSIVSPFKGTTRDVIECTLEISGYQLNVSDTAGIRCLNDSNENYVEKQGIRRALDK